MTAFLKIINPLSLLCNTSIGIGIFSLPYVASRVGLATMIAYLFLLGGMVMVVNLMFAEIALKTPDRKRFPGFAKRYLGRWGEITAFVCTIAGMLGGLVAFMVIGGSFLRNVLGSVLGGSNDLYSFVYWGIGAVIILFGTRAVTRVELWGLGLFFIVLMVIFFYGGEMFQYQNLSVRTGTATDLFLPYGAILFALWSASSILEAEEMLAKRKKYLKNIVLGSTLTAIAVYLLFVLLILGITGANTAESAFEGLKNHFGSNFMILCFFFAFTTSFTSFIILGLTLKKILYFDLKMPKNAAWAVTVFIPLLMFLLGVKNFIAILSFIGGLMLSMDGIMIALMYQKVQPRAKLATLPLIAIFALGIFYELTYFLK